MTDHTLPLFALQPETKEIPLTQEKVAIVDAVDYEWLTQWRWYAHKERHTFYAVRQVWVAKGLETTVRMHREILRASSGLKVDHRDGNGLNNTRDNLRPATAMQNSWNRSININNTSGHKGVFWHKGSGKWQAAIGIGGKLKYLGLYSTAVEAAVAYETAAHKYYGEFIRPILEHAEVQP